MFEVPPIDFQVNTPILLRRKYTTRRIMTLLRNRGHASIVEQVIPNAEKYQNDQDLMAWLSENISLMIRKYLKTENEELIENIFHSIQIWGGSEARHYYLNNENLNIQAYRKAILNARNGELCEAIRLFRQNIFYFNIAFASKHFSFWTTDQKSNINDGPRQLPILDSIIFKLLYGRKYPDYRHYSNYLKDIYKFIEVNPHLTAHSIERHLFNFADTEMGKEWITRRINK